MFPIQLFDISDEGQADKEVPMGVGAKLKLRKLPKPLKASHIMGPRVILAAMGIGMGELFNKYIDPWASTIFFLVAFVQIGILVLASTTAMHAVKPTFSTTTFNQPERYTSVSARAFIKGHSSILKNSEEKRGVYT